MRTIPVTANELYRHYPSETCRQGCYVALNLDRSVLCAAYNAEIGSAVPASVAHGHTLRWTIPALRAKAANDLLASIEPLARRLCDNYDTQWDGQNCVAYFDDADRATIAEIRELCERAGGVDEEVTAIHAADFYGGIGNELAQRMAVGITADTTDDALDAIEESMDGEALANGIDVVEMHRKYLRVLLNNARFLGRVLRVAP